MAEKKTFNAMTATPQEIAEEERRINEQAGYLESQLRELAPTNERRALREKLDAEAAKTKGTPGFDATTASKAELRAEAEKLGIDPRLFGV